MQNHQTPSAQNKLQLRMALAGLAILTCIAAAAHAGDSIIKCIAKPLRAVEARRNPAAAVDLGPEQLKVGTLAIDDGRVAVNPIRNQGPEEICWAFAECGLAEAGFEQDNPGRFVHLSPEYSGFYHGYFQIYDHLDYFKAIAEKIAKLPAAQRAKAIADAAAEAVDFMSRGDGYVNAAKLWVPSQGSFEALAFREANVTGLVPNIVFDGHRATMKGEELFENALNRFITENMFDLNNLKSFVAPAKDGINDALFGKLSKSLKRYLGQTPLRPNDVFTYNKQEFTPLTFMREHLGFNPEDWTTFQPTRKTQDLAVQALIASLEQGHEVPIGMPIFGDQIPGTGLNFQQMAEKTGVFSPELCPGGKCRKVIGGHEIRAVNYLKDDKGKVTGILIENSWGDKIGLNVKAQLTGQKKKNGYFVITLDYLRQTLSHGGWDFSVPKDVASMPQFAALKVEK